MRVDHSFFLIIVHLEMTSFSLLTESGRGFCFEDLKLGRIARMLRCRFWEFGGSVYCGCSSKSGSDLRWKLRVEHQGN